jgi:hypothetical protein
MQKGNLATSNASMWLRDLLLQKVLELWRNLCSKRGCILRQQNPIGF